jgi:hypothetical protein
VDARAGRGAVEHSPRKIASVNPDLAAHLQAQRSGQPDTGGSFFDALKRGVAEVAGLPGIAQVMDWMSRPAKIIPELLDDREGDSVWGNIAQALVGQQHGLVAPLPDRQGGHRRAARRGPRLHRRRSDGPHDLPHGGPRRRRA